MNKIVAIIIFLNTLAFSASGIIGLNGSTANWTDTTSAAQLTQKIQGVGITITNATLNAASNANQSGIFSNANAGANLQIDEGIVLTTMSVKSSFTTNDGNSTSIKHSIDGNDADLLGIDSQATFDNIILEFDVVLEPNVRLLLIEFQFASEEYNEYVGSRYNDAFGFFLSEGDLKTTYNIARVVDSSTKMTTQTIQSYPTVTVNNVNNGHVGENNDTTPEDLTNSAFFIDNDKQDGTAPVRIEYDGITKKLQAAVDNLTPGVKYHFKMAIADTGDQQLDTAVFINKIIGLKEPALCYDYSYSQNGKYFTEFNDGTNLPRISGTILPHDDINTTIYIRNEENSNVLAYDIDMNIDDINITNENNLTQAIYKRESTYIVNTGEVVPVHIPDKNMVVSDANISKIPYNNLKGKSYTYLYYGITPNDISEIDIPIKAKINYTVAFDIGGGDKIIQNYNESLGTGAIVDGKHSIPLCDGDNRKYEVDWGIFNVVSKEIYKPNSPKYNIPTQVVKQPEEMLVIAHNENNLTSELKSGVLIGIDLIDAGKFHNVKASCDEPTSSLSPIIWMAFKNSSTIDLKQEITKGIEDKRLTLSSINNYFTEARQNAAYRISYITTNDDNEYLINTSKGSGGTDYLKLNNFTQLVQNIKTCKQPVRKSSKNLLTTEQVSIACANAGNKGLNPFEYQRCMKCLFGYNTHHICSRDNFAIRPESFNVKINDQNQTDKTKIKRFANNRTGIASPNNAKVNITTGYAYKFDINATDHDGNNAASGYTRYFTASPTNDHNMSFVWDSAKNSVVCNDLNSKALTFNMVNGTVKFEGNATNVGEYRLNIIDKGWTKVDQTPIYHHGGAKSKYFLQNDDCIKNSSIVTNTGSDFSSVGMNGCNINSNNHNNMDAHLKYRDYNIIAHPYKFNLNGLVFSGNTNENETLNNTFLYTADVGNDNNLSRGMALHVIGTFAAQGHDNSTLSNFVTGCYAKDVNLTLKRNMETIIEPYVARFTDRNSTAGLVYDGSTEVNATNNLFSLTEGNFTKDNNGIIRMRLDLNFDRNTIIPRDPVIVTLNNFDANCTTPSQCQFQADLANNTKTGGTVKLNDANITHYYGRVHAPDQTFNGNSGVAKVYYEVYCNDCNKTNYTIDGNESIDSIDWFTNTLHRNNDGNVSRYRSINDVRFGNKNYHSAANTQDNDANITRGEESVILAASKIPDKDKIAMNSNSWLTFSPTDFIVEFLSDGEWAGEGNIKGVTVDLNISNSKNRRLDW